MGTFEQQHPRGIAGQFVMKHHAAPGSQLAAVTAPSGEPMNPRRVTIDGEITVDAAHVSAQRWNGWAVPEFTRDQVDLIVAWANGVSDEGPVLEWADGALIDIWRDGEDVERTEIPVMHASDGTELWGVGAMSWVWSEVED